MLHVDETANGAKSEDLEKIVVDDDSENFFSGRNSTTSSREGKADRVSQEEHGRVHVECLRSS